MKSARQSLRLMLRWNVLLAGSLLSACVGGQTGGEDAVPPSLPFPRASNDSACSRETTPTVVASIDETSPAGFSAASVLRHAEGTFNEPLEFDRRPAARYWDASTPLSIQPGRDESLEVEIRYADGELRSFGTVDDPCGRLEIDVHVTLRTSSGAFDETVDGVLMASSPFEARLELHFHTAVVQPYAPPQHEDAPVVPVHPLAGALDVTGTDDAGRHELAFLELVFTFSELGFNGYADGWMYGVDDGSLRLAPLLATIGETCDGGYGFPLGPEEPPVPDAMAPSAREVLALLAEMRIDAVRDDGARSPFSLGLEYMADSACGRPGDSELTFEAVLSIAADLGDARIDSRWPVEIRVGSAYDGALANLLIRADLGDASIRRSELASLEHDWGVTGVEVDGYDEVLITFDLSIEPATDPPRIRGELFIRGYMLSEDRSRPTRTEDGDVLGHLSFEAAPSP
jgi:hypothetical protein